jgi:iron complex outermembrane receptor protein
MNYRKTLLAASIITSLCVSATAFAQDSTQTSTTQTQSTTTQTTTGQPPATVQQANADKTKNAVNLAVVTVTGIRASLQASLDTKRNADAIVDAITATDIGKFPATNVAEALAQVPGVTLDHLFGATQRVSIDGIDPSLNNAFLDGHPVAQALWLYGDSPNRGFNYSLLPPEILGQVEIFKSPEARLPEGSLGGTVFMHTVQPLDVPSNTVSGSLGTNYNDMTKDNRPNGSLFYSWHNDDKTFGVDVSAQHYEEVTSREGQEIFSYATAGGVAASNPAVASEIASGAIKASDSFPGELNSADFQQTEKRNSIFVNLQYKPNEYFDSTLSLMYMNDSLNNINTSLYPIESFGPITSLGPANANGIINSGTVGGTSCAAGATGCAPGASTFEDNDARGAYIQTRGIDWRGKFKGDSWSLGGQAGVSTSTDDISQALEEFFYSGPFSWNTSKGFNFTDPSTADNPNYWPESASGINYKEYKSKDTYAQVDFTKDFDSFFNELEVGARYASHWESQSLIAYSGNDDGSLATVGFGGLSDLHGASSFGLGGSTVSHVITSGYQSVMNAVLNPANGLIADNPFTTYDNTFNVQQQNSALYAQVDFGTDDVHGNIGARYVHTDITAFGYKVPDSCSTTTYDCVFPAGTGYIGSTNKSNDVLPAFNIAWNITPDLILRGAASETIAYAPYNEYAPYFESNDTIAPLTATAGNPNLKPYKSINWDTSLEYYFSPESVIALSGFYKNVLNYVVNAATLQTVQNPSWATVGSGPQGMLLVDEGICTAAGMCQYNVSAPVNGGRATVKGAAISYQQAFGDSGFGLRANYTYSDSNTVAGGPLPYNSKNSYTIAPYFEKGPYNAGISYNYRSEYLAGGYVAGAPDSYTGSYKELDASLGYKFDQNFSVSLNMLNLMNSVYKQYYGQNEEQLANEYVSGREYMLEAHFKF